MRVFSIVLTMCREPKVDDAASADAYTESLASFSDNAARLWKKFMLHRGMRFPDKRWINRSHCRLLLRTDHCIRKILY